MALEQSGIEYEYVEIDLKNKPEWFLKEVNPEGKVPTIKYGDEYLIESNVITEFIADIAPASAGLRLSDPFELAKGRLMTEKFMGLIIPIWGNVLFGDGSKVGSLLEAVEKFQPSLGTPSPFFGGSAVPTVPEIMVVPFIARLYLFTDAGVLPASIKTSLETDAKYATFNAWAKALIASPSHSAIFQPDVIMAYLNKYYFKK
ncbi:uncharacterized protein V1510DRAFT_411564 [Dipodascopsis tothii]|uniref:uncharacterized protein n=1 Tax=Dipodascopsis tothii TaxID=44089 RepID=UPI0034CDEE86